MADCDYKEDTKTELTTINIALMLQPRGAGGTRVMRI